jgi:hypothetical protein
VVRVAKVCLGAFTPCIFSLFILYNVHHFGTRRQWQPVHGHTPELGLLEPPPAWLVCISVGYHCMSGTISPFAIHHLSITSGDRTFDSDNTLVYVVLIRLLP